MVLKSTLYPSNKGNFLKANATSTGLSEHATASFRGFIEDRRSRSDPSLSQAQWPDIFGCRRRLHAPS